MTTTSSDVKPYLLFGVPYDIGCRDDTAKGPGSRLGPQAVRAAYRALFTHFDVREEFEDIGDVAGVDSVESLLNAVEERVTGILEVGRKSIILGGAHTLTLGSLRAVAKHTNSDYTLLYFDAHPDIMPREGIDYGSTLFHAIREGALDPRRIIFIAIRQIEEPELRFIREKGIRYYTPHSLLSLSQADVHRLHSEFSGPYYVSIDLDSVDPGLAPGVSTPFPIGIEPRDILRILEPFLVEGLLGLELVEVAPNFDCNEQTSRLAAALLHHITARGDL